MKKIVLTGGGTAGHVTPNLALLPDLKNNDFEVSYIGSQNGIEKELVEKAGIAYYPISTGKLRRYLSVENVKDAFRVLRGIKDAYSLLKRLQPDGVFSKGGFVSVPVVIAAKLLHIPSVIHESDMTPGLANKISMPFAKKICVTFPETLQSMPKQKGVLTGSPIRKELFEGEKQKGLELLGFSESQPILFMIGGSLGSVAINQTLREALPQLTQTFQVAHVCGKGNVDQKFQQHKNYRQFEYVSSELPHLLAAADLVLSRAGSNSISEFLALQKPNLLIPLTLRASRGDQIANAKSFEQQGFSMVLQEDTMTAQSLADALEALYANRDKYIATMKGHTVESGVEAVLKVILQNFQ